MPTWPASLPQRLLADGFDEQAPDVLLRSQVDSGPEKVRPRFTAGVEPHRGQIQVTRPQLAAFRNFFKVDLVFGALPFDWVHPITEAPAVVRFADVPSWRARNRGALFRISLSLKVLP